MRLTTAYSIIKKKRKANIVLINNVTHQGDPFDYPEDGEKMMKFDRAIQKMCLNFKIIS